MQGTSEKNLKIMSWIAIGIGLLMVGITPFIAQTSLERVFTGLIAHIDAGNKTFASGIPLFDFFYPVWRAFIFVAGMTLIIISQEIKKGEAWTYGLGAGVSMIVGGISILTVQLWAGPMHVINGINYADVWHTQLALIGGALTILGAGLLLGIIMDITLPHPLRRFKSQSVRFIK